MPSIVMPRNTAKDATAKDPSLRAKMGPFLSKLSKSDTTNGLHIEPHTRHQRPARTHRAGG